MKTLYEARCEYVSDLRRRGKAMNTLLASERTLQAFGAFTEFLWEDAAELLVSELEASTLEQFLYKDGLKPASFNRYRSVLNSFFDWCISHGYCDRNPVSLVPVMAPAPAKQHLILSPEELLLMLDNANPVERIALALGMHTGLRASDVMSLTVGDVDLATGYISTTIQKTKGADRKPITAELHEELQRWLQAYSDSRGQLPVWTLPNDWYLVPSYTLTRTEAGYSRGLVTRPKNKLTRLDNMVHRGLGRLDLPTAGEGFHTLRRSSARALFELLRTTENSDHALMVVKEFLNHKSTSQTEAYLGINQERIVRDELLRGKNFLSRPVADVLAMQEYPAHFQNESRIF